MTTNATGSVTAKTSFNATVHGSRGLFAMLVFVYHIINSGLPGFVADDAWINVYLLHSLKFGVELFFGISGFVILGALQRAASIRAFLWDRVTRIYPLLWATLIAITAVSVAVGHWLPPLRDWLLNFLAPPPFFPLPQVNPAAWSLGYEITFYALCAACWALYRNGNSSWRLLAFVVGGGGLVLFPRAVLMPVGLLIAAGLVPRTVRRWLGRMPLPALLLFLIGWRIVDLGSGGGDMMTYTPFAQPFARWATLLPLLLGSALCGGVALLGLAEQRGWFAAWLRTPPMQWLGKVSYSFYLWHPVAVSVAKVALVKSGVAVTAGPAAQLLLAVAALPPALIVAHFSQIYIEVRLTRYLRRHGPREDAGRAPLTAAVSINPTVQ